MASQDATLSKFESDFKQQQSEMTYKIDTVLKAIANRIVRALPSGIIKNPKLIVNSTTLVLEDLEERSNPENIKTTPPSPHDPSISFITEKAHKLNSFLESSGLVPHSSDTEIVYIKGDDEDVMCVEIIRRNDDSREEGPGDEGSVMIEGLDVEYFNTFPTRSELAYHREDTNRGVSNFKRRIKGRNVFVGYFTYVLDFMIVEDISSIIDPRLSQVVLGKPFVAISNMTHDPPKGVVRFTNGTNEIAYKMPHKIEQYNSLSDLEKEHTKLVYLRNEEDKRRGVKLYLTRISLEVLRKFHWTTLGGRSNQLSHVSSLLLSKPGEY
ncbi:hypothetical protein Tco_1499743 [Tanacetum coccineum]